MEESGKPGPLQLWISSLKDEQTLTLKAGIGTDRDVFSAINYCNSLTKNESQTMTREYSDCWNKMMNRSHDESLNAPPERRKEKEERRKKKKTPPENGSHEIIIIESFVGPTDCHIIISLVDVELFLLRTCVDQPERGCLNHKINSQLNQSRHFNQSYLLPYRQRRWVGLLGSLAPLVLQA